MKQINRRLCSSPMNPKRCSTEQVEHSTRVTARETMRYNADEKCAHRQGTRSDNDSTEESAKLGSRVEARNEVSVELEHRDGADNTGYGKQPGTRQV